MTYYQKLIASMQPGKTYNPAGIEAHMRCQYSTLDHLDRKTFAAEITLAAACEQQCPGYLEAIAASYGLKRDFDQWNGTAV